MKLPLIISVPHGGLEIPEEVRPFFILERENLLMDFDEGSFEIFNLQDEVACYRDTQISRLIVDLNRNPLDLSSDGVVKTSSIYGNPLFSSPLPESIVENLIRASHQPYHADLSRMALSEEVVLGVDCHTMAAEGNRRGADQGKRRPLLCLSDRDGETLPSGWMESLVGCFEDAFHLPVAVNNPFKGKYTLQHHAPELPWVQLEISREPFLPFEEKRRCLLKALQRWCTLHQGE